MGKMWKKKDERIRKMKEEQRLKGNLDLEEHLAKIDASFEMEGSSQESPSQETDQSPSQETDRTSPEESMEDLFKVEDESQSSIDDLLNADK